MQLSSPERQDLTRLGLMLEESDFSPTIPAQLFPGITIPFPNRNFASNPASTTIIRDSISLEQGQDIAASTAAVAGTTRMTFGVGLWHFTIVASLHADFNSPAPIVKAGAMQLNLVSPGGSIQGLLSLFPAANVTTRGGVDFTVLLVNDSWLLTSNTPATAVAQTFNWFASITAIRLL